MKTGVCTTDFEKLPLMTAEKLFERIRAIGFACVQFAFSSVTEADFVPTGQLELPKALSPALLRAVDKASERHGLPVEVINATFNMAHPDPEVREEGLRRLKIHAEAARSLGCPVLSLCSGTRNEGHLWTPHPDNGTREAWNAMFGTMLRAAEIAKRFGVTLAVESEASNVIDTPEKARRLMDGVGSERIKMILDPANLFHAGEAHPENARRTLDEAFALFGNDIVAAHGKDIREGDGISFCGTGRGIVDFPYMAGKLNAAGYAGDMFLHGIYDPDDMPRALGHWLAASGAV
ncbi:MAG: sugar phosphate isomerase/epimerase [Ruminococcaceae bacterium]|jgi:sugar phosphate isomerase/epimerase|nr:sugar phosphate isomerase/epimerase [Oscillospiraceae bacterium]